MDLDLSKVFLPHIGVGTLLLVYILQAKLGGAGLKPQRKRTGWTEGLGNKFGPSRVKLACDYEKGR